jgi:alpha-beta hydrolase superfamily lysophospholipase
LTFLPSALLAGVFGLWGPDTTRSLPLTGPYPVGRREYVWTDSSRTEFPDSSAGRFRSLVIFVWYPAMATNRPTAPPLPLAWRDSAIARMAKSARDTIEEMIRARRVHAVDSAPPVATSQRFPVVFFLPGLGNLPTDYSFLVENLVSHGYIVIGIQPTGLATFTVYPDGHLAKYQSPTDTAEYYKKDIHWWIEDAQFARKQAELLNADASDPLHARLDLAHVGIFGHSYGGTTSLELCIRDRRFLAGINLDGYMYSERITTPFMLINGLAAKKDLWRYDSEMMAEFKPQAVAIDSVWTRFVRRSSPKLLEVRGRTMDHGSFWDAALFPDRDEPWRKVMKRGIMPGKRALAINSRYIIAFFDRYLKGKSSPILDRPPKGELDIELVRGGGQADSGRAQRESEARDE